MLQSLFLYLFSLLLLLFSLVILIFSLFSSFFLDEEFENTEISNHEKSEGNLLSIGNCSVVYVIDEFQKFTLIA